MKLPWILQLLWDPRDALDLKDSEGNTDHGKVMGFFAFVCFLGLAVVGKLPSLGITITLAALSFGSIMFRTFLRSRTVMYTEGVEVKEMRDVRVGFQPTP